MGNVNEKNISIDEEKEVRCKLLELVKDPDSWTDETEEQAVETALLHGIETCQVSSPSPKRFQQGPSNGYDALSYELVTVQGQTSNLRMKNEACEDTGNISLPLSESIIPQSFEAFRATVSPAFTSGIMPLSSDIRSPDSVEELTEHTALLAFGDSLSLDSPFSPSPDLFDEFQTGRVGKISEAVTPRSAASNRAAAITEQILESSPLALASNSLLISPHQVNEIPIISLPPPPMAKPVEESTAVLSPLVLGLSTLANTGDTKFPCRSELEGCRENKPPLLTGTPLKELVNFEDTTTLDNIANSASPHVAPLTPRRKTIPLPPLSTEDRANLFVSEIPSLESSSLGLVDLTPPEPASPPLHFSSPFLHIPNVATESNQSPIKALPPFIPHVGSASEPLAVLDLQAEARPSVQVSVVEDEAELLRAAISFLNLDASDNDNSRSTCQATRFAESITRSSQEARVITPEADSQVLSLAVPNVKTHADTTDIAMQDPELANLVLQAPLASQCPSTEIDQYAQKVDDRSVKHFPGLRDWVEGPVEEDISLISSTTAPSGGSERGCGHTPNNPNWAIAPVLDSNSPLRSSKSQRDRGRRRGKKMRIGQGNGSNFEDARLIFKPLKLSEATPSKLVKKESPKSIILPHDQSTASEELQNITLTNPQKVDKWINESASVIWSPKSGATRGSRVMVSCNASIISSGLEQVSDGVMCMVRDDSIEKIILPTASKTAEILVTRENSDMSLNDRVLAEDDYCSKRTDGSIPTLARAHARGLVSPEEDWKINLSKGKKFPFRSSTPSTRRSRSASIASSLASGVSKKSGVSASSRLFQRAIERIGSKDSSRPIYGVADSVTCHNLPDRQNIEARGSGPAAQVSDPPQKLSPLDSSLPINAVTEAERTINRDAALCIKGKVEAVTSSYQTLESCNYARTSDEHFAFTFKTPQASIGNGDPGAYRSSRNYNGSLLKTPAEASNTVQSPRSQPEGKTPRPSSLKTFIPIERYVQPPVRVNEMLRHGPTPATIRGNVTTRNSTPNPQTKVPRVSWPRVDTEATAIVTTTHGMNVHAPRYSSSDDVSVANCNEVRRDVMADAGMHFATENGPSGGVQRTFGEKYGIVGHHDELNSGSPVATVPDTAATVHTNRSGSGVQSRGAVTALDLPEVDQKLGIPGAWIQTEASESLQQLNEYMAKLSLAQKRIQANVDQIVKDSTSGYDEAKTCDSIKGTDENRQLEQASSVSFGAVAMKAARLSVQPLSTSINPQARRETRASARYPTLNMAPRLEAQMLSDRSAVTQGILSRFKNRPSSQNVDQSMFEEFCRRQRQETRTVNENVPSKLPRRKV